MSPSEVDILEMLGKNTLVSEVTSYNDIPCWRYKGTHDSNGYGKVQIRYLPYYTHRLAVSSFLGRSLDRSEVICHHCDVPDCWNPFHLFLGTRHDNNSDRALKRGYGNAKKTHCPQGHPYDVDNIYMTPRGMRVCRACNREKQALIRRRAKCHKDSLK